MYDLYNPDTLKNLCHTYGLHPSAKYGQNFLIDPDVIGTMLDAAQLKKTDTVIEVGPGFGVLTEALAGLVKHVSAFEIERKLVPYWERKNVLLSNVKIIWGNVLRGEEELGGFSSYKVVANLPYQITSAVIRLFLEVRPIAKSLTFMVQKEVAERICAQPGDLSVLALAVQYYADPTYIATVPKTAFWPSPAVDSAIIHLKPHARLPTPEEEKRLFRFIKFGFSSKRKLLSKNLLPAIGKDRKADLMQAFEELRLVPTVRAQELSLEQWQELVKNLCI